QLLHCRGTVSPGLQQFPGGAMVYLILAHPVVHRFEGDGGDYQTRPALLDQDTRQVIEMEALHGDRDETLRRVVQPAERGVAKPIYRSSAGHFRLRIVCFDRIVDDQCPATATGQRSTYRCRQTIPPACGLELDLGGF